MSHFSGTVVYEKNFNWNDLTRKWARVELDLGIAHEHAQLWVNGQNVGVRMWRPYLFEIGTYLKQGTNILRVSIHNTLANRYDGKSLPSGLMGPIRLLGTSQ
jgi:hypothetical protein